MFKHIRVYEESDDNAGFEHVNPANIKNYYISSEEDGYFYVTVEFIDEAANDYPFANIQEARNFIRKLSGTDVA